MDDVLHAKIAKATIGINIPAFCFIAASVSNSNLE
jgi:hypothetical protein